jgi:hypothetical protein
MKVTTHVSAVPMLLLLSFSIFAQARDSEELLPIVENGKMGYIAKTGHIAIRPQFDTSTYMGIPQLSEFSAGLAAVRSNKKTGYIDVSGQFVIAPQFIEARNFSDGLAAVKIGEKWGYVDKRGLVVITPTFKDAGDFSEGLAQVEIAGKLGYIDRTGKVIIEPRFRRPQYPEFAREGEFREGVANVRDGMYYLMIDRTGKIVGKCVLDCLSNFYDGLALVEGYRDGHLLMGYMDKNGRIAIEPTFKEARAFSEGLASVSLKAVRYKENPDKWWYYIDRTGRRAIKGDFYHAGPFSEGLAAVARDNYLKRGYIDRTGTMVIEARFDWADRFKGGVARVLVGNKWGYINKSGSYVWEPSR